MNSLEMNLARKTFELQLGEIALDLLCTRHSIARKHCETYAKTYMQGKYDEMEQTIQLLKSE